MNADEIQRNTIDISRVRPTFLNVLVRVLEGDKTEGGLYLPPMSQRTRGDRWMKCVAVGPGDVRDGVFVVPPCKPGDEILVGSGNGWQLDDSHWIMPAHSIISVLAPAPLTAVVS